MDEKDATARSDLDSALTAIELLLRSDPEACLRGLERLGAEVAGSARAQVIAGRALLRLQRSEEALAAFERVLALAHERDDGTLEADAEYWISAVYFDRGAFDDVRLHAQRALDALATAPDNPVLRGRILTGMGLIHFIQGELDIALDQFVRAETIVAPLRDMQTLGSLYSGLAATYEGKGELELALHYARLRVATHRTLGDIRALADGLTILAISHRNLGAYDEARKAAEDGLRLAEEVEAPQFQGQAHAILASLAYLEHDLATAARHAETVLRLIPREDFPTRCDAVDTLAAIAESCGDHDEADRLHQETIRVLAASTNRGRYTEACMRYSQMLEKRGDAAGAMRYARMARVRVRER